jgi:3',5'-cyclic-nucleotide phosphodiesterase
MIEELSQLAKFVDPIQPRLALKNLKVVVTHIKETLLKGPSSKEIIQKELEKLNTLNIQFIFPEQGQRLEF